MSEGEDACWGDRESMIAIAQRILHNKHDAEDVVQETLLAVWKLSDQIEPVNRVRYLNRAIRQNAIKRRLRQRSHDQLGDHEVRSKVISHADVEPIDLEEAIQGTGWTLCWSEKSSRRELNPYILADAGLSQSTPKNALRKPVRLPVSPRDEP